jgi:hypothetical protein
MARKHSKLTVIQVVHPDTGVVYEFGQFCQDSNCEVGAGTEENTTYGKNSQVFDPTLNTGAFGASGKYDSATDGPRAILKPLRGRTCVFRYRPEGTGSGLPQDEFAAVITKYVETAPFAGYRTWALETQPSDDWDESPQA